MPSIKQHVRSGNGALNITPEIGFYYSECCMEDCYQIKTKEELDAVNERIKDNEECGELHIFKTYQDALEYFSEDNW